MDCTSAETNASATHTMDITIYSSSRQTNKPLLIIRDLQGKPHPQFVRYCINLPPISLDIQETPSDD
jgi:hypothetical protein